MSRQNIDFGIDLGTTNSAIAMLTDTGPDMIKDGGGERLEIIPSAVWVTKSGGIYVGRRAKDRIESDPDNACGEFKLQMGIDGPFKEFTGSGRTMTPEELSTEVLKSLRGNVTARLQEEIDAAVITIPAAFELHQCEATRRAAQRAGLAVSPLLQEPTAAAFAYSYDRDVEKAFWLVYDFGGGTFDAAVISVRDGEFTVVNHSGDNFLGGKLIDWDIVDDLLIPAIAREYRVPDLPRRHPKWRGNIAKLKAAAEQAKIELSHRESTSIMVDLKDEDEAELPFEYELTRSALERIAEPYYLRSIDLSRRALADARLGPADIEKVLLVGGTTLAPAVRELLCDPAKGLGIELDQSQDPVTVVARGAAIFAGTQQRPTSRAPLQPGQFGLDLTFQSIGDDPEPFVGGRVRAATGQDWSGFTIEFVNTARQPAWRSAQIPLTEDGAFTAQLWAQQNTSNTFSIELQDSIGMAHRTTPDVLSYRHRDVGVLPNRVVLPHSVGVGLANNDMFVLIAKGAELKARKTAVLRSTIDVSRADGTGVIRIPVLQGEQSRADRNRNVGTLTVAPHQVKRDVPVGSEVHVTIEVDASQGVTASAYVPFLDEDWDIELELSKALADVDELRRNAAAVRSRLAELRHKADAVVAPTARTRLTEIDADRAIEEIDRLVTRAQVDPDAVASCEGRLQDLSAALDEVEDALQVPELLEEIEAQRASATRLVAAHGDQRDRQELQECEREIDRARRDNDMTMLHRQNDALEAIKARLLKKADEFVPALFRGLRHARRTMTSPAQADRLIEEGERALARGDRTALTSINEQLTKMLPAHADDGTRGTLEQ
ncbi:MAG: Hsp70 family protein [Pseudonocardiaceae bacterium]